MGHAGPQRAGTHRLPAACHGREGRGAIPIVRQGGEGTPKPGSELGRPGVGRMTPARGPSWKWWVCGALLLATMLLYMDRLTLSVTATQLKAEIHLDDKRYGR